MSDDYERAIASWTARAATKARELGGQWTDLAGFMTPTSGGDGTGIRGTTVHAAAPIRLETLSLRDEIKSWARRIHPLIYGTLRMGIAPSMLHTPDRLRFIGGTLPALYAEDPALCEEVVDGIWSYSRQAAGIIDPIRGTIRRPFRIDEECPECEVAALWVDPARWVIACGMPDCRARWGVAQPVLRSRMAGQGCNP
jgi:hypothetical protein